MKHPMSLEEAEAGFGIERVKWPKMKESIRRRSISMASKYCPDCGKRGYLTKEAAYRIIARMVDNGTLSGPTAFSFHPYFCSHGWWHLGHNYRAVQLFAGKGNRESIRTLAA